MPIRVQVIRSSVKGQRPTIGTREPGELYVSFADLQLGVVNAAKTAQDLIAIRFFAATTDYVTGNFVVQAGTVYRAKASITAGAFNASQWDALSTSVDLATKENVIVAGTTADYWRGDKSWVPLTKGAVGLGNVDNTSDASKPVSTATQTALNLKVDKAGDTMSGHLSLPTGPGNANAVRKDYVDSLGTSVSGNLALKADIASPTFTGDPKAPTPTAGDNDTSVATTAFVTTAVNTATSGKIGEAPIDGIQYVRQNANWSPVSVPPGTAVSDAPPGSPAAGQLWFESDSGRLFIYYTDANSSQWVQLNGPPIGGGTAEARSRIVNGAMQISQENGVTGGTTHLYYAADQWRLGVVAAGTAPNLSLAKATGTTPNLLFLNSSAPSKPSLASGDYLWAGTPIEGIRVADFLWGTASAKQVVLRFTAWGQPGTYAVGIRNGVPDRTYVTTFVMTATATDYTIVIPGDTIGTWAIDNTLGMSVSFCAAAGASMTTAPNVWTAGSFFGATGMSNLFSSASQFMRIANVGLYLDPNNTGIPPVWQMPDEAQELIACMRYFERLTGVSVYAYSVGSGPITSTIAHKVSMRLTPALTTLVAPPSVSNVTGLVFSSVTIDNFLYTGTVTATGHGFALRAEIGANARM